MSSRCGALGGHRAAGQSGADDTLGSHGRRAHGRRDRPGRTDLPRVDRCRTPASGEALNMARTISYPGKTPGLGGCSPGRTRSPPKRCGHLDNKIARDHAGDGGKSSRAGGRGAAARHKFPHHGAGTDARASEGLDGADSARGQQGLRLTRGAGCDLFPRRWADEGASSRKFRKAIKVPLLAENMTEFGQKANC